MTRMTTPSEPGAGHPDLSFLAPPGALADWRMVLAYEAASTAGVLDALPGTLAELAARSDVDEGALRAVLGQLVAWDLVAEDAAGCYSAGSQAPLPLQDAMLVVHATVIRRWATVLGPRLGDRTATAGDGPARPGPPGLRLDLLAVNARRVTRPLVDACLARFPHARRVLDLGGGHGEHSLEFARRGLVPTMQDRPEVVEAAEQRGNLRVAGIDLFAGDFFTTLPTGPFDIVLISGTTNMFDGAANRDLYRRLRPIIAPEGGLAIASYLRGRDEVTASFGLQMLAFTDGGDAHTERDYRAWLAAAGYGTVRTHEIDDPPQTVVLVGR